MKKIISLFLTIAMLASMFTFVAGAEGNAAVFFENTSPDNNGNWFQTGYFYTPQSDIMYTKRDKATGDFNYAVVLDVKFTNYATDDNHHSGLFFTPLQGHGMDYTMGYSFDEKAFVGYLGSYSGNPSDGITYYDRMGYDLPLNEWHEIIYKAIPGKAFQMYLDGVLMIEFDIDDVAPERASEWDWLVQNRNYDLDRDSLFIAPMDCDMYIDNIAIYSGDYDIKTGTATTTHCEDADFARMSTEKKVEGDFGPFRYEVDPNGYDNSRLAYRVDGAGTDKVTYDREFAANHAHEWVADTANSATAHCLTPGFDLYTCECGASEQRNYVEPLGHLPGTLVSTDIVASEDATGVETRRCNRQGCMKTYKKLINLTGETDKALHMYTLGRNNYYNGYMAIGNSALMAQDDGVNVIADIMPISHYDRKFAGIGADVGKYWLGYDYYLGKFVVKNESGNVIAESDKALNDYEWAEWRWFRDGLTVSLYINGEEILTAELPESIYDEGIDKAHLFVFLSRGCEILLDNVIVAYADYDYENRTGVIYDTLTFNNNDYVLNGGSLKSVNGSLDFIMKTKDTGGEGWVVEAHGLPTEDVVEIHRDMALKVDSNYEDGSIWSYSQFGDSNALIANDSVENPDGLYFEYSFDFYAYDWCTDEALLSKKVGTDEEGNPIMQTGSAFIGGHVNSNGNAAEGNGFIGYDFIRQQAVIGSVSEQAGGVYGENNVYADYAIEKDTWHRYTFKYDFDIETNMYVLSILIDGNEVLSTEMEFLTISYYIYFPNFVKGYQDNLTVKLGNNVLEENTDFTNGFGKTTASMDFTNGGDWSLAAGGVPTHVYEAQIFPASCDTDGYSIYSCSCGESVYTAYDQPHTGHAWDDGKVTVEPTTEAEGEMTFTCTACGDTYTETIEKLKPEFTYGDVNGDGKLQLSDLSALRRYIGGATSVSIVSPAADVNGDGKLQLSDVSTLGRKLGGANVTFGPAA